LYPHKRLTDLFIEELEAPSTGRTEITDVVIPELKLRHTPDGHKSFSLRFNFNGERGCRFTIGPFSRHPEKHPGTFNTKLARDAARVALGQIADGIDPREAKRAARRKMTSAVKGADDDSDDGTWAWASRLWIKQGRSRKKKLWRPITGREYRRILDSYVLPKVGELQRTDTAATNQKLKALISRKAVDAPVQANFIVKVLRILDGWSLRNGFSPASILVGIEKPEAEISRDRAFEPRELAAFWRAATAIGYPFGHLFQLLALIGQRREMVRSLAWSWIDFERHRITFPRDIMKMDRAHIVHLSDAAIALLQSLPRISGSDLVFTIDGKSATSGFSHATNKVRELMAKELGEVQPFTLHDLRRSFATIAAEELRIAPHIIDRILAHTAGALSGIARVYQRAEFLSERETAMQAWGNYVTNLVEPKAAKGKVVELRPAQ
jgi:integrase